MWCYWRPCRKCYSLKMTLEDDGAKNRAHVHNKSCSFCCVQSNPALNRKCHRADCVNLVLITPTHISVLHLHLGWVPWLVCLKSHWPWLCLWGRSRFLMPWGGSNVSSTTSSHPLSATGHPLSPVLTQSRHRNTPDTYTWTEIDVKSFPSKSWLAFMLGKSVVYIILPLIKPPYSCQPFQMSPSVPTNSSGDDWEQQ